jgi:hypothetical protein
MAGAGGRSHTTTAHMQNSTARGGLAGCKYATATERGGGRALHSLLLPWGLLLLPLGVGIGSSCAIVTSVIVSSSWRISSRRPSSPAQLDRQRGASLSSWGARHSDAALLERGGGGGGATKVRCSGVIRSRAIARQKSLQPDERRAPAPSELERDRSETHCGAALIAHAKDCRRDVRRGQDEIPKTNGWLKPKNFLLRGKRNPKEGSDPRSVAEQKQNMSNPCSEGWTDCT